MGAVRILGPVPDIASLYDSVRLTCAPLAYGAGVKGKVLESLAAGLPCACTTIAAEGLDLPTELQALVADEPAALAALIRRLHDDEDFNASLVAAGRRFVAGYAADDAIDEAMRSMLNRVTEAREQPAGRDYKRDIFDDPEACCLPGSLRFRSYFQDASLNARRPGTTLRTVDRLDHQSQDRGPRSRRASPRSSPSASSWW